MSKKKVSKPQKINSIATKIAAVKRHIKGESLSSLSRELKCSVSTIHGWKKQYEKGTLVELSASPTAKKSTPKRKSYVKHSELFKINIVKRYEQGESVLSLAKEHGINENTIYTWMAKYKSGEIGKNMDVELNEKAPAPIAATENSSELFALRRENVKLKSVINLLLENDEC